MTSPRDHKDLDLLLVDAQLRCAHEDQLCLGAQGPYVAAGYHDGDYHYTLPCVGGPTDRQAAAQPHLRLTAAAGRAATLQTDNTKGERQICRWSRPCRFVARTNELFLMGEAPRTTAVATLSRPQKRRCVTPWDRVSHSVRWRCARLYLSLRAAEVAAGTAGTGHSGCAEREAGVTANAGTG